MRIAVIVTVVLTAGVSVAQPKPADFNPAPRFNVLFNERFYQQSTPKLALAAVIKAAELGQYDYITAYLFDEATSNERIVERAKAAEKGTEADLRKLRAIERADPFKPAVENPLPIDPVAFAKRIEVEASYRGFYRVVAEIKERFEDDPSHLRELQKYLRDGELTQQDTTAKLTLKSEKGKAINFKKIGTRWFLEDRVVEAAAIVPETKN
ncbi:hypothetical protein BH11PLA2_BH11PLA2_52620 [soil metagenome]